MDFLKLNFGSWENDGTQKKAGFNSATHVNFVSYIDQALAPHEVRLLFGQNKLRYESGIFHPRGNRGRIDIDFSQVCGVHFDFEKSSSDPKAGYKVTVQLSSPPATYVGIQAFDRFKKTNTVYESEQTDFSDGAVKSARTHTFTVDNANRLKTMKQRMEENGFSDAIAKGTDETLLTATFSEEEIEASMEKGRGGKAKKSAAAPKKRSNENAGDNDNGEDGEAGPSAAAPKAKPAQPKKPNPKALPGLLDALPEDAGEWLQACVSRWNLIAPFDPTIPDEMWESYYRERAALDWYINEANGLQEVWTEETAYGERSAKPNPAWTEDFPKPPMYAYLDGDCYQEFDTPQNHVKSIGEALKKVVEGCPQLTDEAGNENIGDKLAAGVYVLEGYTNWDDDDCRSFDCKTRLYSPYGLGTAVDFKLRWHFRQRMTFTEHFATVDFAVRSCEDINHLEPQKSAVAQKGVPGNSANAISLFSMDRADSGYLKRTIVAANKLRKAEETLFGRKNLLSERKMFNILMCAASSVECRCVAEDLNENIVPFSRRKWKKFVGEEGDSSENDCDSENEERKKNKRSKKERLREMQETFGDFPVGFGNFYEGDDSDDGEEKRDQCSIM